MRPLVRLGPVAAIVLIAAGSLVGCTKKAADTGSSGKNLTPTQVKVALVPGGAAIDAMGGKGNLVHLTGNKVDSNTQRRIAGVQKAVDEAGGQVKILDTVEAA